MSEIILTIIILGGAVAGILFFVLKYRPHKKSNIRDLYSEGLDMLITGHRRGAYQNFRTIIQKDTNNIKAYLHLGQVIREGGNPEQALKVHKGITFRKNLTQYEKLELHKNLSLDYKALSNVESAIIEAHNMLTLDKANEWAISQLIKLYRQKNNWAKAGEYLELYQKITNKIDNHKVALFKIEEGRIHLQNKQYSEARLMFEEALNIDDTVASAYYFIGNTYSAESEDAYQLAMDAEEFADQSNDSEVKFKEYVAEAKQLLGKAIPMWIKYTELSPNHAWLVIHLLKDALFALDRYPEVENILKQINRNDPDNIEVLASLADFYAHRGDSQEALELIETAQDKDSTSLLVRLIKLKLEARKNGATDINKELDSIIHFLVTDKQYQIYKNTSTDSDLIWLYGATGQEENLPQ
jgi:lipopolysaccharide biosynthesis regulator YciM